MQTDFEVDAVLVARLVNAQHPDLAGPTTFVGNGYPWPWSIVLWFDGVAASDVS